MSWLVLAWWFYHENPAGLIRPTDPEKGTLIKENPMWYQTFKSISFGMLFNPIPMFFLYFLLLIVARVDSKFIKFI